MEGGISKDDFKLTIRLFDEKFKVCLVKRKNQEQWILNLRYPDKSTVEYLEYLENCTDCNKDHVHWPFNNFEGKNLYQYLVKTVGTEIEIRTRQRLFIIQDIIQNEGFRDQKIITSGSLAEGIDLPGSDIDTMILIDTGMVIQNAQSIKHSQNVPTIIMVTDTDYPGFTRLRVIGKREPTNITEFEYRFYERTSSGIYASVKLFSNEIKKEFQSYSIPTFQHGPCFTDRFQDFDFPFCFQSEYFPDQAISWSLRDRKQWPPQGVIARITNSGCLFVPIGPRNIVNNNYLWRISFSLAEKKLVYSFNYTQLLCYGLLKLTLRRINCTHADVKDLLCSYFLKTALFWVSEETDINTFQLPTIFDCFSLCLKKIKLWVNNCYCPNYFIPEHNMFLGKITMDNNEKLLNVLDNILTNGIDGLRKNFFSPPIRNFHLVRTKSETVSIVLDFLFYRISLMTYTADFAGYNKILNSIFYLLSSEKSAFIIGVCKYNYAKISQYVVQLLPPPTTNGITCNINKQYHKHLEHGMNADASSGGLLYASYYYVTGQYKATLILVAYVLSICQHDFFDLGKQQIDERDLNNYIKRVHNLVNLNQKMKISTIGPVVYTKHSSLIPFELRLEVECSFIEIQPYILAHILIFLCYHHLSDVSKSKWALRRLNWLILNNEYWKLDNPTECYYLVRILGVCYEISGDNDTAKLVRNSFSRPC